MRQAQLRFSCFNYFPQQYRLAGMLGAEDFSQERMEVIGDGRGMNPKNGNKHDYNQRHIL
jgi:hypothetical protein